MDVDTHLGGKEDSTDALVKNEAVKEEIAEKNTEVIEKIKIGSNNICVRKDLAKEEMVFWPRIQPSNLRYG